LRKEQKRKKRGTNNPGAEEGKRFCVTGGNRKREGEKARKCQNGFDFLPLAKKGQGKGVLGTGVKNPLWTTKLPTNGEEGEVGLGGRRGEL